LCILYIFLDLFISILKKITLIQMNTQDVFEIGIQQKKGVCGIPCLFYIF